MDSDKLSARSRQPGHDRSFVVSEENFHKALCEILPDPMQYRVVDHPNDLSRMLGGRFGIRPEASIEYIPTQRKMYFEVKKQGPVGNADERACKHHTVQFYKSLAAHTGYDYHAFATIMCESLATLERYTVKHPYYFEPDHYFLWVDYKLEPLRQYVEHLCERYLTVASVPSQELPS